MNGEELFPLALLGLIAVGVWVLALHYLVPMYAIALRAIAL